MAVFNIAMLDPNQDDASLPPMNDPSPSKCLCVHPSNCICIYWYVIWCSMYCENADIFSYPAHIQHVFQIEINRHCSADFGWLRILTLHQGSLKDSWCGFVAARSKIMRVMNEKDGDIHRLGVQFIMGRSWKISPGEYHSRGHSNISGIVAPGLQPWDCSMPQNGLCHAGYASKLPYF